MSVDPGEGYRLLQEGDAIPKAVDYWLGDTWRARIPDHHVVRPWSPKEYLPMRVRVNPIDSIGVEATTSGPYIAIEVHRAALAEIERLKAELDKRCEIWRIARDIAANERDAAESEVKRLKAELEAVKQPANTAENAYGYCPICGAPGVSRERRLNGNDRCSNGHEYPSKDAMPSAKPNSIVFHEFIVKHSWDNEPAAYHLEWSSDTREHANWIPTGRTETREVVR